jgi:chlorobactene glucosyltransferase
MLLLEILLGSALVMWLGVGILALYGIRGATVLGPQHAPQTLPRAPKVSVIVAARNEETKLAATLESLLGLDYPHYEVILVDDDSTDRTGLIADDWAGRPQSAGRLKVIHNRELPPGWRGKVHALSLAARAATGQWLLATDADVVFHPAVLRLAVSHALEREAHFVSLLPEFQFGSWAEKVVLPTFSLLLATLYPLRVVNNPKFPRALAAGAFILMRRHDLEVLGGYAQLRNVVIEDLRLAELFKRKGWRISVHLTRGLLHTRMYSSWREIWQGLGRSAFEGTGYSLGKVLMGVGIATVLGVLPWVSAPALAFCALRGGGASAVDPALALALATCMLSALVYVPLLLHFRLSPLYVLTMPLATAFYSAVALHSAWASLMGRGVPWKGRHHQPPG